MYNDYELVYLAQEKNEDAINILYKKYHNYIYKIIKSTCKQYNFNETELEDIDIECTLVLDNAINTYNQDKDSKFVSYLKLLLNSKLTDIIRKEYTKKAQIEKKITSIDDETTGLKLHDILFNNNDIIDNNYIDRQKIIKNINNKTDKFEKIVLKLLIEGKKPEEISIYLDKNKKNIYNTIYILKNKIKNELK